MHCPFCRKKALKVVDSRESSESNAIRRRRECLECLRRFTTFETIEFSVQVLKRDGRYEEFQKEKLIKGLDAACRHTGISQEKVVELASKISDELMASQIKEIGTNQLGETVMKALKEMDPVAYIRFACVYKRLTMEELIDAIRSVHPKDDVRRNERSDAKILGG